eukprot:scaffold116207_cov42-Prasinocladus_malaysianus.AAC.1
MTSVLQVLIFIVILSTDGHAQWLSTTTPGAPDETNIGCAHNTVGSVRLVGTKIVATKMFQSRAETLKNSQSFVSDASILVIITYEQLRHRIDVVCELNRP